MKKKNFVLTALLSVGFLLSSCTGEVKMANYQVIPLPLKIEITETGDYYTLSSKSIIAYPEGNEKMQQNAEFLAQYVKETTGMELGTTTNLDNAQIQLGISDEITNPEGYTLQVSEKGVEIIGGSEAGVFYGIQTLRKSLPVAQASRVILPAVNITDEPRFGYRGSMLDVSRHFFTVDSIKRYIDILALHNVNRFHWHLSDDQGWRIEIKKRPLLTELGSKRKETVIGRNSGKYDGIPYGGYYTQDEVKDIIEYAATRYITIVPEIDLPGHMMGALHAYPELGCTGGPYEVWTQWGVSDEVLCAGNDATLEFIEEVLTEITEIFPSEYIHVGGDECPKVRWSQCPKCQARIKALGIKSDEKHTKEEYLQSFVIKHAAKVLTSKGRKMIGWDETLEGGLAPGATVMSWRSEQGGIEAAKQKHHAIMTPNSHMYFDHYQNNDRSQEPLAIGGYLPLKRVYNYNPAPKALTAEELPYIIGVQANLWTEYIPTFHHAEYMLLPRLAALSEVQWCAEENKDYDQFIHRLARLVEHYQIKNYNYAKHVFDLDTQILADTTQNRLCVVLNTLDNCPIYYTLDGTEPTEKSAQYTDTIYITESCTIKAIGIRPTYKTRVFTEEVHMHKASLKPITLVQATHPSYTYKGAGILNDGIQGDFNYKTGKWIAFNGTDLEAVIDLQESTEVKSVSIQTLVEKGDWVFGARGMAVSVSEDGVNYTEVSKEEYPSLKEEDPNQIYPHTLSFEPTKARYLKVYVTSEHAMPEWHGARGTQGFLFVDEIVVE